MTHSWGTLFLFQTKKNFKKSITKFELQQGPLLSNSGLAPKCFVGYSPVWWDVIPPSRSETRGRVEPTIILV